MMNQVATVMAVLLLPLGGMAQDYCSFEPDTMCYVSGWPTCCGESSGVVVVAETTMEDVAGNATAISRAVNETTPTTGTGALTCPATQPSCELGNTTSFGGDYCGRIPDFGCYASEDGFPLCCSSPDLKCPKEKPSCEVNTPLDDADYCYYPPDLGCYVTGWPTCCSSLMDADIMTATSRYSRTFCPLEQPSCELGTAAAFGGDYCERLPDDVCYVNGYPVCCTASLIDPFIKCPRSKPSCEIEGLIEV